MHGSEVLYCHSAGEPSKMERRSAALTSEMPNVAMIGRVGSLLRKTSGELAGILVARHGDRSETSARTAVGSAAGRDGRYSCLGRQ